MRAEEQAVIQPSEQKYDDDRRCREIMEALRICRNCGVSKEYIEILELATGVKLEQEPKHG